MSNDDYARMTGAQIRERCRAGAFRRPTPGVALGFAQANLVILRSKYAADFERFCTLNPRPCPLMEVTEPGNREPKATAPGADVCTDLPRYRVYRGGKCVDRPVSVESYWTDDCVAFLIGCSFTFDAALLAAGLPVRHIEEACNVPMYRTNRSCRPAGPFAAPLIVSMRPMTAAQAKAAVRITAAFSSSHGEPVQIGDPAGLGIADLDRPDYGHAVTVRPGEIPVFWACGVTPLESIVQAKPDVAITHDPGHMFVTDVEAGRLEIEDETGLRSP